MSQYTMMLSLKAARSRLLLTDGDDEIMRAILPPPRQVPHGRAAMLLLQGLAMWLDRSPRVVVCADDADATFFFGLTDELGNPQRSVFYDVTVAEAPVRRRRPRRIVGIGNFHDLHQRGLIEGGRR